MSCIFANALTVDLIVQGAIQIGLTTHLPPANAPQQVTAENADAFGRMLWAENARAYAARYPAERYRAEHVENAALANGYTFTSRPGLLRAAALMKLAEFLDYQCAETSDYRASNASLALSAIIGRAVIAGALRKGAGIGTPYHAAPWGASNEQQFPLIFTADLWADDAA